MNTAHDQDDRPVFGYIRVSDDHQEVARQEKSIPERHRSLPDGLADRDLQLFYDKGISAWSGTTRPGFEDMLARIQRGEAAALIIDTSSRLTRQGIDAAVRIFLDLKAHGTQLFTTEGGAYEFNAYGWIRLILDAERDENYSSNLSHNVTTGKKARVEQGRYHHGQLPPGYRRTPEAKLEATDDLEVMAQLFKLFISGRTYAQLGEYANSRLSAEVLDRLKNGADHHRIRAWLGHPLYVGMIRHRGKLYESDHPPAVTEEVWEAAQAKLDGNRAANAARAPRAWPFAGIAKCWCGHSLRLHGVGKRVYLRCHDRTCRTNSKAPIASVFEANVILGLVSIAYAAVELLDQDSAFAVPADEGGTTLEEARERVKTLNAELERVRDLLITTGGSSDDTRLVQIRDQRDAAREEQMLLARDVTDHRAELTAFAQSLFSLRFHIPEFERKWLSRDWAMMSCGVPAFPDEMAEAVLLGWQYADFDTRCTVIREALSTVIYYGDSIEWHFRIAIPEALTTGVALEATRSPLVNELDADGWGNCTWEGEPWDSSKATAEDVVGLTGVGPCRRRGLTATRARALPRARDPPLAADVTSGLAEQE